MALSLISSIVSSAVIRRRLPVVGAVCMLSLGLSILYPSLSLSSKTTILRSKFSGQTPAKGVHTIRMAASNKTVPSIGVYVIVPNKDADKTSCSYPPLNNPSISTEVVETFLCWAQVLNQCISGRERYRDSEELLIIKTRESLLEALKDHVKANHKYDVPEVIALPIVGGSIPYLEWLKENTRG